MKLIPQAIVDEAAEDVYNIRMELYGSPLSYDTEHVAFLEKQLFKAGVEFCEKEVLKHIEEIIIENQGLKLFKDKNDAKFPNGITSYLETFYEVVSYIVFKNYAPENAHLWELVEDITDAFELKNKGRAWNGDFFEEVIEFTHNYLPDLGNDE